MQSQTAHHPLQPSHPISSQFAQNQVKEAQYMSHVVREPQPLCATSGSPGPHHVARNENHDACQTHTSCRPSQQPGRMESEPPLFTTHHRRPTVFAIEHHPAPDNVLGTDRPAQQPQPPCHYRCSRGRPVLSRSCCMSNKTSHTLRKPASLFVAMQAASLSLPPFPPRFPPKSRPTTHKATPDGGCPNPTR